MNKNQKGMTLIEMVIVIAIIGLMLIPIYNIMGANDKVAKKTTDLANAKIVANKCFEFIENELKYANTIIIGNTSESSIIIDPSLPLVATNSAIPQALYIVDNELKQYIPAASIEKIIYDKHYMGDYDIELIFQQVLKPDGVTLYSDRISITVNVGMQSGNTYVLGPNYVKVENINTGIRAGDRITSSIINIGDTVVSYIQP